MRPAFFLMLLAAAGSVALLWGGAYGLGPVVITRQDQAKIVLRLGNPVQILTEPGVSWRIPFLDRVRQFDRRLQYLNAQPVEMLIARGEKLIIDYYGVWRITDPLAFLKNYPKGIDQAEIRIQKTVNSIVGATIGGLDLAQLLQRGEVLSDLEDVGSEDLAQTGVELIDVQLNRIELPRNAESAAYAQMREQRNALSREHRAVGERNARKTRAEADREAQVTIATASSQAEITRGEGDAVAARIYADAYNQDPDFYAFWRSLEAYRATLKGRTTMVLSPDHAFFRYLDPSGAPAR